MKWAEFWELYQQSVPKNSGSSSDEICAKQLFDRDGKVTLLLSMLAKCRQLCENSNAALQRIGKLRTTSAQITEYHLQRQQKWSDTYKHQEQQTLNLLKAYLIIKAPTCGSLPTTNSATAAVQPKRSVILRVTSAQEQNKRSHQEDRYVVEPNLSLFNEKDRYALFAVLDGHAGSAAADFLKSHITPTITKLAKKMGKAVGLEGLLEAMLSQLVEEWDFGDLYHADPSGSTITLMLVDKEASTATFLNLGDSRTILCAGEKKQAIVYSTKDHDLDDPEERARVEKRVNTWTGISCRVTQTKNDALRVCDSIAMSRAFGDNTARTSGCMSREADLHTEPVSKNMVAVLGSDGLYDEFTSAEIESFVISEKSDASDLVRKAVAHKKVQDNCTAIVIRFE